jgi:hypothetical protein
MVPLDISDMCVPELIYLTGTKSRIEASAIKSCNEIEWSAVVKTKSWFQFICKEHWAFKMKLRNMHAYLAWLCDTKLKFEL